MNNVIIGEIVILSWRTGIGLNSLYLSRDGQTTWELLTQIAGSNDPEKYFNYSWLVTGNASDDCYLRVIDEFDNEIIITNQFIISNFSTKQAAAISGIGIFI